MTTGGVPAGSIALVTGAGSGLGQLTTWRLAAAGTTVLAADVDEAGLERTARRAPTVQPAICDVADAAAVGDLVARAESELGAVHRLVNAAAIAPTGLLAEQPVAEVERLVSVNVLGVVHSTAAVLPHLLARGRGEVVQYGSLAGWLPTPYFGAYSAAKAAVVSYSETLHHELTGTGVQVVCVCPPIVDTPLLEQIEHRTDAFDRMPRLDPEVVLDAVDDALAAGRCFAFPGRGTAALWRLRRFAPGLLWRRVLAVSGELRPGAPAGVGAAVRGAAR